MPFISQSALIWQLLPTEEEEPHLLLAQGKGQFAHHNEDREERCQPDLDRPKRRMGELLYCASVGFCHTHPGNDRPDYRFKVSVHEGHDQVDRVFHKMLNMSGLPWNALTPRTKSTKNRSFATMSPPMIALAKLAT